MDPIAKHYLKSCQKLHLQPVIREKEMDGFYLKFGSHYYHFRHAYTPFNGVAGVSIAMNKFSTNKILAEAGIPVPKAFAWTLDEFRKRKYNFDEIKYPVVVKPSWDSDCGFDVVCNIKSKEELINYFEHHIHAQKCISVEEYHGGLRSYRVLVFYDKVIGVVERFPAHVIGDGQRSIRSLIRQQNNERRILKKTIPTGPINLNEETDKILGDLGLTLESIPDKDELIPLRYICNSTHGGTFISLATSVICAENARLAVRAARALDLNLVGFDVICQDISIPIEKSDGYFVEANPCPDITIHEASFGGIPNMVTEKMIKKLINKHYLLYLWSFVKQRTPLGFILRLTLILILLAGVLSLAWFLQGLQ